MTISVIIPTMNRVETLARTFCCLEETSKKPDEIIVVDQSQANGIAEAVKSLCEKSTLDVTYIWNSTPSLTKARNTGYDAAHGDIIVFMDDDVDVKNNTFNELLSLFSAPNISMVGGFNENENTNASLIGAIFGKSSYWRRYKGHVTKAVYGRFPIVLKEQVETEWAMGFFFAIRKKLMDEWELSFDEKLKSYAYAEDLDFTYRYYRESVKRGLMCIMSSKIMVRHNISTEYRTPSRKTTVMKTIHRIYLCKKLFGGKQPLFLVYWSDFGDIFYRVLHREPLKDLFFAFFFSIKHRGDILRGEFHYDEFM